MLLKGDSVFFHHDLHLSSHFMLGQNRGNRHRMRYSRSRWFDPKHNNGRVRGGARIVLDTNKSEAKAALDDNGNANRDRESAT